MGCTRVRLRQLGRSRKKYPLVRNPTARFEYVSNTGLEIDSLIVEVLESDSVTVSFEKPFSAVPSVVANVVSLVGSPIVGVYVESVTAVQTVIRTTSPITGQIHVHAMHIAS